MSAFRFLRVSFCAVVVSGLGAAPIAAQEISGTISGSVADEQGQVLPGATVTSVNERTSASRTVTTDDKGNFQFTATSPYTWQYNWQTKAFLKGACYNLYIVTKNSAGLTIQINGPFKVQLK